MLIKNSYATYKIVLAKIKKKSDESDFFFVGREEDVQNFTHFSIFLNIDILLGKQQIQAFLNQFY